MLECPYCKKEFGNEYGMKMHIRQKHPKEFELKWRKTPKIKPRICPNCKEYHLRKKQRYCDSCKNIVRMWEVKKNGSIKELSDKKANRIGNYELEMDEKITGTFILNWPFCDNKSPEIQVFENDDCVTTYLEIHVKQLKAIIELAEKGFKKADLTAHNSHGVKTHD